MPEVDITEADMQNKWLAYRGDPKFLPPSITFKAISKQDMAFLSELYRSTRWEEVLKAPWNDQQRIDFLSQQFEAQHTHYLSHYPHAA